MAKITKELNTIDNNVLGGKIRFPIHDAIDKYTIDKGYNGTYSSKGTADMAIYTTPPSSTVGPTTNTKDYFRFATSAKQSVLAPFAVYGKANGFTFSPYAFWIPVASDVIRNGGWKKVHIDGKNYATDGCWALRDG